jgi:hypothetical protein
MASLRSAAAQLQKIKSALAQATSKSASSGVVSKAATSSK